MLEGRGEGLGAPPMCGRVGVAGFHVISDKPCIQPRPPTEAAVAELPGRGVIVTAPGNSVDVVSRFFAPGIGIPEDPVTGSAHCSLAPYWATRLGKPKLAAQQLSNRGGRLQCEVKADRVLISGRVQPFLEGEVILPSAGASA